VKLIIRITGEHPHVFDAPEWDWSFGDNWLDVWSVHGKKVYRYPYTTIYLTEVISA
jgi:hypothetical protein